MSQVRALRIKRGTKDVGTLFDLEDGRVYFQFDDAYIVDSARLTLSVALLGETEAETRAQLAKPPDSFKFGGGKRQLPVFFRNLLPEGVLRKQLIADAGIGLDDEMALLSYCGEDLPGDISALPERLDDRKMGRLLTEGHDSFEFSSHQLPTPQAVSLSGVQPKVDLVHAPGGRYVMRSKTTADGAHFIGKLPASDYEGLPEVEYISLKLALAAGVNAAEAELLPLHAIADKLPFTLRDDARSFLLVRRFDRDAPVATGRLHMEDFAQVLGFSPDDKYRADYASIGIALLAASSKGEDDVLELLRRIKVNELLGNYDAHAKNFSLLYNIDGKPALSPAYDVVAYGAYMDGRGHALRFFPDQTRKQMLTPMTVRTLANVWELNEKKITKVLRDTVDNAMRSWPGLLAQAALSEAQKKRLLAHIDNHPDVISWRRRQTTP
ncbi:MAG: type II toxin-antitoxin system HipA family toxin [Pseudomonadota bacterium]